MRSLLPILLLALAISSGGCQPRRSAERPPSAAPARDSTLSLQYEIRREDSGRTFVYSVTTRFTLVLDSARYPRAELRVEPDSIVGSVSSEPAVAPPFYAARYEAVRAGTCRLLDRDFQVTIHVVE